MDQITCSQCKRTGQILSNKGLCWHCYTTKEKSNYRYMVNSRTQLLLSTILLCAFFLLNAIPTIRLGHEFTNNYSKITNDYLRIGKDIIFLFIYSILKICFVINIWKNRYQESGAKYFNVLSEFIVFIIKLVMMNQYLASPLNAELRLSGLIEALNKYTEDTLSSEYLAFFIQYCFIFLIIRVVSCILAGILNYFCNSYFHNFYEQEQYRNRINNIAHWEYFYKKHPNFYKKQQDQVVAAKSEKTLHLDEESLRKDLENYTRQDEAKRNLYLQCLLSNSDSLSLKSSDLNTYLTYIKDKISIWKEDNLATDNYLDEDVISDINNKLNCIKERYQSCLIENQTYFKIYQQYTQNFDLPLKQIMKERREVKQSIDQLYMYSDMLYWHKKCKEELNVTIARFEKQAINLSDYCTLLDGESIDYDHILITNRGLFILDIETFDPTLSYDLIIERDGNWYKRYHCEDGLTQLESLSTSIASTNNSNLLKLEKHLNKLLNRPLDQYIELKGIVILSNDDIMLENSSSQIVIRATELFTILRSYPIQYNEEQMLQFQSILTSQQLPSSDLMIANYRKQIIDPLDSLLEQKIQLIQTNSDLIQLIDAVSSNITKKNKYNFLPLYLK